MGAALQQYKIGAPLIPGHWSHRERAVFISLQQLERNPVGFDVELKPENLDLDGKVSLRGPLYAKGSAVLINRSLGEIRVEGVVRGTIAGTCDRCLEATELPLENRFDLLYAPEGETGAGGEEEVEDGAIDVGFYEGNGLELNDVLRELVLLALPMQVVCSPECRGICPVCAQNRNATQCDCQERFSERLTTDRWSKLRDYRPRPA